SNQTTSAPTTINSLVLGAGGAVSGASALTINSGLIASPSAASIGVATLVLGNGIIRNDGDLAISSTFSGSSLTKFGDGVLTLSGANLYSGNTLVAQGTLRSGASNVIPDSSTMIINGGANW